MRIARTIFAFIVVMPWVLGLAAIVKHKQAQRPQTRIIRTCPPFDQCTPKGAWNHPNCGCRSL